jgi:Flp pilus assembly protein CpaB
MRRGRIFIFLILIVVVGVVVLGFGLGLFNPNTQTATTEVATIEIYYASQNIPQGTIITQEMLSTYPFPLGMNVAEVMFTKGEEANLVGQRARFTLEPGTVITSSMIGSAPSELPGPSWAVQVPPGMVAVAIPTNRLATAAYGVNDGAYVNVIACMTFVDVDPAYQTVLPNYVSVMRDVFFPAEDRPYISIDPLTAELPARQGRVELDPTFQKPIYTIPSELQRPRLVCQMILQDKVVMKLGNFQLQAPVVADPNVTPSPTQSQQEIAPDIVTLMVTPQDSIALNYFVYSGAVISMTLRNPGDRSLIEAQSATLTYLLTQYNISLPSKLPYAQQPRLDVLAPPLLPNDIINVQPQQ